MIPSSACRPWPADPTPAVPGNAWRPKPTYTTPGDTIETGYRSHFIPMGTVAQHGDPVTFVTAWLDFEAERTGWRGTQLSLF